MDIVLTPIDFFSNDTSRLGECEFYMISEMNSQLIVHHPYRSLTALSGTFSLTQEESSLAWSLINDHYMSDLPLVYPPHLIAIVSILLSLVLRPSPSGGQPINSAHNLSSATQAALTAAAQAKIGLDKQAKEPKTKVQRLAKWLAESDVDIEGTIECIQELISLYEVQEQYNEKLTREQINRFVKARGLDK